MNATGSVGVLAIESYSGDIYVRDYGRTSSSGSAQCQIPTARATKSPTITSPFQFSVNFVSIHPNITSTSSISALDTSASYHTPTGWPNSFFAVDDAYRHHRPERRIRLIEQNVGRTIW